MDQPNYNKKHLNNSMNWQINTRFLIVWILLSNLCRIRLLSTCICAYKNKTCAWHYEVSTLHDCCVVDTSCVNSYARSYKILAHRWTVYWFHLVLKYFFIFHASTEGNSETVYREYNLEYAGIKAIFMNIPQLK